MQATLKTLVYRWSVLNMHALLRLLVFISPATQLDAVIKLLPRLQYGLDVNVRFNSVRGFEFTEEMAAFDLTGITLLHGWVLDPEDKRTVSWRSTSSTVVFSALVQWCRLK